MIKFKYLIINSFIGVLIFLFGYLINSNTLKLLNKPLKTSGALEALDFWAAQRAYPERTIPDDRYYAAYNYSKQKLSNSLDKASADQWSPIGPHNIGGRTLAVALNPQNPNTIFAGSASGGLWRSFSTGIGTLAWHQISTGLPVLSVSSIAIVDNDSNTIYIGTGEVYGYQDAIGGLSIRTTRGSYGIGILKTTNGGLTWTKSLDWSYNQKRGVRAVKINPQNHNTIFAATTEGVFKSTNGGTTWQNIHNVIMAMDLIINPIDTNIIFVGCGDLNSTGRGIYRTTNCGTSWVKLANGLPSSFGGKAMLAIYESSPNVVLASIGNGSSSGAGTWLCKSTNNGDSWTTVSTQDYSTYQGWYSHYVGINPIDSSKIICGGIDIWKSTTGGTNLVKKTDWAAWYFGVVPPGGPEGPPYYAHADHHAITYHPTNPNIIYFGTDGGVFCSTDGGETFSGRNGGYQTTQFYNGFSSAFTDSFLAIGGMQDNATAIYEGTVAWRRVIGGDGCWTAIHPINPDTIYGSSQNLNILKSINRGYNWLNIAPPSSSQTSFTGPYILSPSHPRIMYAGRDKIYKSTVGGGSWVATNNNQPLDGNPAISLVISFSNPDTVYCGTTPVIIRSGLFRTINGGTSWQNITGTLPDRYPVDIAVDPNNSSKVYVIFSGFGTSHIYKSSNAGNSWLDIGSGLPDVPTSSVIVDPIYPDHIYVGNDIGVYVSTNGGNEWQEFQSGMPDAAIIMDLSISKTNRKLRAITHGNGVYERPLISPPVFVSDDRIKLSTFKLFQNYPNPFNNSTIINYQLAEGGEVTFSFFDITGQEIYRANIGYKDVGDHSIAWEAGNYPSGVYYYKLQVNEFSDVKKMIVVK